MKHELNSSDSEKSLHHNENIVGAYDTESTHSEKLCPTYVNTYVCPFKPVKDSVLKSTTLSGEWHQLYLYIQIQVSCKLVQKLLFTVIHQNNEYFCNPFFNIKLNTAFVISLWDSTTACYGTGPAVDVWQKLKSLAADAVLSSFDIPTGKHSPTQLSSLQAHQYTY
jgi:hypothetical protein